MVLVRSAKVSLKDVALKVGVSRGAVAKVLNGTGGDRVKVSEATAKKIRSAAKELNYRPNLAARQLVGKSSKLISAVIDTYANHDLALTLANIEEIVSRNGYRLMVGYTHDSYERIKEHVEDFHSRGVDGVICMAYSYPGRDKDIEELFSGFEHCVFVGSRPVLKNAAYIGIDQAQACKMATEHLIGHGYKRIALMLPTDLNNSSISKHLLGYLEAHAEGGVQADEKFSHCMNEIFVDNLPRAQKSLATVMPHKPEALVVGSDEAAIWYIKALSLMGYSVPEDIAIVTLEHWSIGQGLSPTLTSIDYNASELAKDATEMLLSMIKNPGTWPAGRIAAPKLVIGQSCGCSFME